MRNNSVSTFQEQIKRGIEKDLIKISEDNIIYYCSNEFKTHFKINSEEEVRASFFVELVLDYKYPPKKISMEYKVPRRIPKDRADIVVFSDSELNDPYIVVECKKDGISDAEFNQAIEQAFGNSNSLGANYTIVVAGATRRAFNVKQYKPLERRKNIISDLPINYDNKPPIYRFISGGKEDTKKVSKGELIRALKKAHDTVWQGGKLAPTTAFDEVSKLLFCKLKDEGDTIDGDPYKFQIGTGETYENVFRRISSIYNKAKKVEPDVFKDNIQLDPKVVYSVVEHLQSFNLCETDLDTKGVAFEMFMSDFFKGKMGQYFTPREIIKFCVKMINPTSDESILDPACGSGGFLLNSMDFIKDFAEKNFTNKSLARDKWRDFARTKLYGIEINDQIARICKMNMKIHEDGHGNIISTDALQDFDEISEINDKFKPNHFDIILTNPPFGASVKKNEKPYLENYHLKGKNRQKTEILFIERCIEFLKPGGRMAIVLPDGILSNSSLQPVRDFIMKKTQILAIISLPQFAFAHYGAGVKSSLVFLRKKVHNNEVEPNIFMAIAEHIGYDTTGKDDFDELNEIIFEEYQKFLKNPKNYDGLYREDE